MRCLTWMLNFQERMFMFWNYLTFFTNIKVSTNSAFISYTFNIFDITLITSNIMMNNLWLNAFRAVNWWVWLNFFSLWSNLTFYSWLFKNGLFNLTNENWKELFEFLLDRKLAELTWTTRNNLIKLRWFIRSLRFNLLPRLNL